MRTVVKKIFAGALCGAVGVLSLTASAGQVVNGAGASFPAPVYRPWTYNYGKASGVKVNYQSVGSGAGIRQIKGRTVDFGASDKPLKKAELDKHDLMQFPMLMGGVVVVVNIPGIKNGSLKLSSETLSGIFLGKIKKWDDKAIAKDNPDMKLPSLPVTVVHRSDGSGTTWIFTNYLTKISSDWAKGPGNGKAVKWPCGIGGQKNPGVANNVRKIRGAIGYVEYTYATEAKLNVVSLKNKAGKYVKPSIETFQAAGASAEWEKSPDFYMVLTDQPGEKSWPITGVTYILIYKEQKDAAKAKEMLKYFTWCYNEGAKTAWALNYVPIPENVIKLVKEKWNSELSSNGKKILK